MTRRRHILQFLMLALAILPVLLFAYQGQFSRIIADDFTHLTIGRILGPWESLLYWRNIHNGSYSDYFLHGLVAPLDTLVPRVTPTVILALWTLGLAWLVSQVLATLQIEHNRLAIATAVAALTVAAAINALYIPHAFFWYSANTRYLLPLAILSIYLAIVLNTATRLLFLRSQTLIALAGGVICFSIAGFSELYMLFQLSVLSVLVAFVFVFIERSLRSTFFVLFGAGWVATCVSLVCYLTAPGLHLRMAQNTENLIWSPIRALPDLLTGTLDLTFQHMGHQKGFAGFAMLCSFSFFLTLCICRPTSQSSSARALTFGRPPLMAGLFAQFCFIPILWTHVSDNPQVFGRFSFAFATVVSINAALAIGFLILLWWRQQVDVMLKGRTNGWLKYSTLMLALIVLLFALTQLRSIHYKAATYLFSSALVLLLVLCWQLSVTFADARGGRYLSYATTWLLITALMIAVLAAASLYTQGGIQPRVLSSVAFMQVAGGLIWGSLLGILVMQPRLLTEAGPMWMIMFKRFSLLLVLVICIGILFGHASSIARLKAFADEWDERHELMLYYRGNGRTDIEVPPLTTDITEYFCCSNITSSQNANYFYGFKSVEISSDES